MGQARNNEVLGCYGLRLPLRNVTSVKGFEILRAFCRVGWRRGQNYSDKALDLKAAELDRDLGSTSSKVYDH